jgi:AICAR transformylase/IMP cyclohydrolase PurH (only IMP cyclohydrolase domain in Aful)
MIRSASKNFKSVYVVIDANDYETVLESIISTEDDVALRRRLAAKAFRHTAEYDSIIGHYLTDLNGDEFPDVEVLGYDYHQELRYGEIHIKKQPFIRVLCQLNIQLLPQNN